MLQDSVVGDKTKQVCFKIMSVYAKLISSGENSFPGTPITPGAESGDLKFALTLSIENKNFPMLYTNSICKMMNSLAFMNSSNPL